MVTYVTGCGSLTNSTQLRARLAHIDKDRVIRLRKPDILMIIAMCIPASFKCFACIADQPLVFTDNMETMAGIRQC